MPDPESALDAIAKSLYDFIRPKTEGLAWWTPHMIAIDQHGTKYYFTAHGLHITYSSYTNRSLIKLMLDKTVRYADPEMHSKIRDIISEMHRMRRNTTRTKRGRRTKYV